MLNCQPENNGKFTMAGQSLPSVKGNVLEAINVGIHLVNDRFKNTDLKHSLNHFILVTPGTGLFDVDYSLMHETSKKMLSIDCALDIVLLESTTFTYRASISLQRSIERRSNIPLCPTLV